MYQIFRPLKASAQAPTTYGTIVFLLAESDSGMGHDPTVTIRLDGAGVSPATMEGVRVALGETLGLAFFDNKMSADGLTATMKLRTRKRRPGPSLGLMKVGSLEIIDAITPRDPNAEAALERRFYLSAA